MTTYWKRSLACITAGLLFFTILEIAHATFPFSGGGPPPWLDYWTFDDTNSWITQEGHLPISFTNVTTCRLGELWTATLDSTDPAWLQYAAINDGTNLLTVDRGTIMFWFATTSWTGTNTDGGTGPGQWSRLVEVGSYTEDASYG